MNKEQSSKLRDFLLSHYNKGVIDLSLYDYFYFNNLYLITADCFRIYIDDPIFFKLEEHIKKQQKWNKTIESAAYYILREQAGQRIFNQDRVILIKSKVTGLDLSRLAKVLHQQNLISDNEFQMISKEAIIIALDTPIYIEHSIHSVAELLAFIN